MAIDPFAQAVMNAKQRQLAAASVQSANEIVKASRAQRIAANAAKRAAAATGYAGPVPAGQQLQQWAPNFQQVTPGMGQQVPLDWQFGRGAAMVPANAAPVSGNALATYNPPSQALAAAEQPGFIGNIRMANPGIVNPNATAASLLDIPSAGGVGGAGAATAEATSLAGQLGGAALPAAETAGAAATPGLLASLGGRAALMRGGAYGAAGYFGGKLENQLVGEHPGTAWDEAATGAVTGAGVGAGFGALGGPFAGLTVPVGAGIGGLIGGAIGLFGPKQTGAKQVASEYASQAAKFNTLADQLGLSGQDRSAALGQLQAIAATTNKKSDVSAAGKALMQTLPDMAVQQQARQEANTRDLAIQSMMAGFMSPYLGGAQESARSSQSLTNSLADAIGGTQGKALKARAAQTKSGADQLTAAYASQIAMGPQMQGVEAINNIQKQTMAQIYAQIAANTSASQGFGQSQNGNLQQSLAALGQ